MSRPKDIVIEIGALDRIEVEKDPKAASKMTTAFIKELVGNGYKATMKASKLTERLLLLRKDLERAPVTHSRTSSSMCSGSTKP